jgi:hypothetical protein
MLDRVIENQKSRKEEESKISHKKAHKAQKEKTDQIDFVICFSLFVLYVPFCG